QEQAVMQERMIDTRLTQTHIDAVRFSDERLPHRPSEHAGRAPGPSVSVAAEPPGVPNDLARLPEPPAFVGRGEELAWLAERFRSSGAIALIDATNAGGVGTSPLVARAARQARPAGGFADGSAVLSCVGHRDALDLLRAVLARFDPEERQPEARDSQGLAVAAGALLDGKHPLIVLEDAPWELSLSTITRPLVAAGATVVVT